jgi:hypothetical protein
MVGAPESPALIPPRGPAVDVSYIDGGHAQISVSTSQGAHRLRFLALMMRTLRSLAPAPPRGPTVNVFYVDGGHSRISISTF